MKKLILLACVLCCVSIAYADRSELVRDAVGAKVQGFASNGRGDVALTAKSVTVDMSNEIAWSAYVTGGCKFRTMTTATKAGMTRTLPAATWMTRNIHPRSQFINFTGCTNGELQRQ